MKDSIKLFVVATIIFGCGTQAYAWSSKTHKAITKEAISQSALDAYIKARLGMEEGLVSRFSLDQSTVPANKRIRYDQLEGRIPAAMPLNATVLDLLKLSSLGFLDFGPWVTQGYRSVEDECFFRRVGVNAEIAESLELVSI